MSRETMSLVLVEPAAVTSTVNAGDGPAIHTAGMPGLATMVLAVQKATGGTSPTCDVTVYETDDDPTGDSPSWSAVSALAFTRVTDAADSAQQHVFRPGERKKYLTAKLTIGGTDSPSFRVAAVVVGLAP